MANNFKKTIDFVGLNYKKEIYKIVLINLIFLFAGLACYLFLKQITYSIGTGVALAIVDYFLISGYSEKKNRILDARENEFISIIGYFQIFIGNKCNVYRAFEKVIDYSSEWMGNQVREMLRSIDSDKSVKPFSDFAKNFKSPIVSNVMLSIYQMIDEGESGVHLMQFTILFQQLSQNNQKALIDKKINSISSITTFPLAGAGAITMILAIGIISIVGDLVNVI